MQATEIRFAEVGDTPLILGFIKELAAYEKMSDLALEDGITIRDLLRRIVGAYFGVRGEGHQ